MARLGVMLSFVIGGIWVLAQPYLSIHQVEADLHRAHAHFSERQWDSVNGYHPSFPVFRSGASCALTKQVMGYHPYWAGTAFTSYQWNLLSTVVFFSYEVDPATGSYSNPTVINTWRSTSLVPLAQSNGTEVQLCATLFGGTDLATFLSSTAARRRCIDSLISLIAQRNADGINIDFEGLPNSQRTNFTNFMQQLRDSLNRRRPGAKLSVALPAVDWNNSFDVTALSLICDQLFIMGYDFYWSTATTAGPTGLLHVGTIWGSRCNSRTVIDYLANGSARHKLILGVPYYGFRYPTTTNTYPASTTGSGTSRTYAQAYNEANTYGWNWEPQSRSRYYMYQSGGQWYQTWWHDSLSLAWIYRTVNMQGIGGVGMWALSYDGTRPELWGALRDHFTSCMAVSCQDTFFDMGGTHGSYFNRENWTWTLAPTGASQVSVTFHSFQLENGYDTLFIYNGSSSASPLIGAYTGTASPGSVTGTSGALTFRYKSDNATTASGWLATWSCIQDLTPPTTALAPLDSWYGRSFYANFLDSDNQVVAQGYVCIADYDGSRWGANGTKGFAYEDFPSSTLPPGWTLISGSWTVGGGFLTQSDETSTNTNLSFSLQQDTTSEWLYHWKMRLGGAGTNRRAGLHIFVSDPSQSQRGDSYLLWFRLDNQRIEIYRITGNVLPPSPQYQQPYPFSANTWYDIKATYHPTTGLLRIWIDNVLVGSWTDPTPLRGGGYLSLRTGNARVDYDEVRVYRSRGSAFWVEVGPAGHARYESSSPIQTSVRILSLVRDQAHLWSAVAQGETKLDWTLPTSSVFVTGWKTTDYVQSFTDSDALSGISRRFFLPVFRVGSTWQARDSAGFLYADFTSSAGAWVGGSGTWSVSNGTLLQSDVTSSNTGYHHLVLQDSRILYRTRARLTNSTGNRRWGFHLLADDPSLAQRGNSYLIWFRYDSQDIQVYETIANTLYLRWSTPFALTVGADYLVEVLYDSGYIGIWVDGIFVGEWTDTTPLLSGSYVSLRTNQAQVEWDFFEVWRGRALAELLTVGPTGLLAAQNQGISQAGGRIFTRVMDEARNFSAIQEAWVDIDWTPPDSIREVRDGFSMDESITHDGTQLAANWDASTDPHSGILTYEYAIGTNVGLPDVVGWTSIGDTILSWVHTGLSLVDSQYYYFGVRARNRAGLIGPETWSDGILYVQGTSTPLPSPTLSSERVPTLRVYPSPAQRMVMVECLREMLPLKGYLINSEGRILRSVDLDASETSIPTESLSPGIYWLWFPPYAPLSFFRE